MLPCPIDKLFSMCGNRATSFCPSTCSCTCWIICNPHAFFPPHAAACPLCHTQCSSICACHTLLLSPPTLIDCTSQQRVPLAACASPCCTFPPSHQFWLGVPASPSLPCPHPFFPTHAPQNNRYVAPACRRMAPMPKLLAAHMAYTCSIEHDVVYQAPLLEEGEWM